MAKQNSIVKIRGTVDDLTFKETKHGNTVMKRTRVVTKERIATDPKFARLRENMSEFQRGIDAGKLLRMAAQDILVNAADRKLATRLTTEMMKVLVSDPVNKRGQRSVMEGDASLLKGFGFNPPAELSLAFKVSFTTKINRVDGKLGIDIPGFIPEDALLTQAGASHFKFHSAAIEINFGTQVFITKVAESPAIPVGNDPVAALNLSHDLAPASTNPLFLLLGIKFYQEVNGVFYPLKSGAYNALSIVDAQSAP